MKYRNRAFEVDAFKFSYGIPRVDWPEWLKEAASLPSTEINAFFQCAGHVQRAIRTTHESSRVVAEGDYLVFTGMNIEVLGEGSFNGTYEPVPELSSLGKTTDYRYDGADREILERFENPMAMHSHDGELPEIEIVSPEFTSLCPITGQPDFATIRVKYHPDSWCVESKSWKLYLGSYRQHKEFHEACVERITKDLCDLLDPYYLWVRGEFTPRGGISFWPTAVRSKDPNPSTK